jgi:hypothetical protein
MKVEMRKPLVLRACRRARSACGLLLMVAALGAPALANEGDEGVVPEIDPGSMAGALTLLVGGTLMLTDRFRRK